jgi:hypothetical protein
MSCAGGEPEAVASAPQEDSRAAGPAAEAAAALATAALPSDAESQYMMQETAQPSTGAQTDAAAGLVSAGSQTDAAAGLMSAGSQNGAAAGLVSAGSQTDAAAGLMSAGSQNGAAAGLVSAGSQGDGFVSCIPSALARSRCQCCSPRQACL